ncbi:MAG: 2Fe-2S iron-sulfur cluster-binding protein [Burkholderiaceae bacterium]
MFDSRPKVNVTVSQTGEVFECPVGESVLKGMLRLGRQGIPVGCVNGGCGVCKIRVTDGEVTRLGPISRAHVTVEEEQQGFTLACRVSPASAVTLEVAGKLRRRFSERASAEARYHSSSKKTP